MATTQGQKPIKVVWTDVSEDFFYLSAYVTDNGKKYYAEVYIDPEKDKLKYSRCECETFKNKRYCPHVDLLKKLAYTEYKAELEKVIQLRKKLMEEALNW
jgi:hypothetical protein